MARCSPAASSRPSRPRRPWRRRARLTARRSGRARTGRRRPRRRRPRSGRSSGASRSTQSSARRGAGTPCWATYSASPTSRGCASSSASPRTPCSGSRSAASRRCPWACSPPSAPSPTTGGAPQNASSRCSTRAGTWTPRSSSGAPEARRPLPMRARGGRLPFCCPPHAYPLPPCSHHAATCSPPRAWGSRPARCGEAESDHVGRGPRARRAALRPGHRCAHRHACPACAACARIAYVLYCIVLY
mmetsp:Transcript_23538/g.79104  ORF Transcript_23538/g.79104 Transcript_23538/m.79104 type:complete len:245 (+) Transcript_23538:338-1072(+)